MQEEKTNIKKEEVKKMEQKVVQQKPKQQEQKKPEQPKPEIKKEEIKPELKTETKVEVKEEKPQEKKVEQKDKITRVYFKNVPISTKHSMDLCRFIKNKNPSKAIRQLEQVMIQKMALPMRGEIPHRKGKSKNNPRGRYPTKSTKQFIKALKNLIANAKVKTMDVEKLSIYLAKADLASRPVRATRLGFGPKKFKRTNFVIEAREK
jgi:large subunit ribosomal protein L22